MDRTPDQIEVCATLIEEHRQMERLLDTLGQSLEALTPPGETGLEAVRAVMGRVEAEMNTHFACEEEALFPAVTPYHPMVLMEVEHEELIAQREELLRLLAPASVAPGSMENIQNLGRRFISELLDHIAREDAGIFPACERSLSVAEKEAVIAGMAEIREKARVRPTPSITRPERSFEAHHPDLRTSAQRALSSARLFELPTLEAKHITVQAGQSLAAHWTPKLAVLVCLAGEGRFFASDESVPLEPGTVIRIDPQLKHGVDARTDCHLLLLLQTV